ncbi:hypothetical protein QTP88_019053 [Uroleucon formosanum]
MVSGVFPVSGHRCAAHIIAGENRGSRIEVSAVEDSDGHNAFLPENKVLEGIDFLRIIMPSEAIDLVDYFDITYVYGSYRSVQYNPNIGIRLRNIPPSIWNVLQTTLDNGHRTNNQTERWNHRFSKFVDHNYPSIWTFALVI